MKKMLFKKIITIVLYGIINNSIFAASKVKIVTLEDATVHVTAPINKLSNIDSFPAEGFIFPSLYFNYNINCELYHNKRGRVIHEEFEPSDSFFRNTGYIFIEAIAKLDDIDSLTCVYRGFKAGNISGNEGKLEIWFTPNHLSPAFESYMGIDWPENGMFGIFFTNGDEGSVGTGWAPVDYLFVTNEGLMCPANPGSIIQLPLDRISLYDLWSYTQMTMIDIIDQTHSYSLNFRAIGAQFSG